MRGWFITVEGGEGAGKSTNLAAMEAELRQAGIAYLMTREPGGTSLGEEIREVLLAHRKDGMTPMAELLLMFAARAEHLKKKIEPALARGVWVISDRFTDATYAYQGCGRGLGEGPVLQLEALVQGNLRPDATIVLDVPVEVGLARAAGRGSADRFEAEARAFFERVREGYAARVAAAPERYRVIRADRPLVQVTAEVREVLAELVSRWRDET